MTEVRRGRAARHWSLVMLWALGIGNWAFAQAPLPPATVSFLDGSFLRGEIESLNGEVLKWRHPNARQPIEFSLTNLNLIRLPPRAPEALTDTGPVCRVSPSLPETNGLSGVRLKRSPHRDAAIRCWSQLANP